MRNGVASPAVVPVSPSHPRRTTQRTLALGPTHAAYVYIKARSDATASVVENCYPSKWTHISQSPVLGCHGFPVAVPWRGCCLSSRLRYPLLYQAQLCRTISHASLHPVRLSSELANRSLYRSQYSDINSATLLPTVNDIPIPVKKADLAVAIHSTKPAVVDY
jgi:hypothetical protein